MNYLNRNSGRDQRLHGGDGEPDPATWLHRRTNWKNRPSLHPHLLSGKNPLDNKNTKVQQMQNGEKVRIALGLIKKAENTKIR